MRTRSGVVALLAAGTLLLAGCASATGPAAAPVAVQSVSASPAPTSPAATPSAQGPAPLPAASTARVTSVTIGSIGVRTTKLETLAVTKSGQLAAPEDPDRAGWYADGTVPGEVGPAVIAGHVDSKTGPAVFYDLKRVKKSDTITVGLSNGRTQKFSVDRVVTVPKEGFPTDEVFGPTPDAELRLITCGGPYDRVIGSYKDNTVVFATLVH